MFGSAFASRSLRRLVLFLAAPGALLVATALTSRSPKASSTPRNGLIAFEQPRGTPFNIWLIRADGTHERQLTHGAIDTRYPAWSPDGKQLAVTRGLGAGPPLFSPPPQIWVMKANGSRRRRVTSLRTGAARPDWSPDGKTLAFEGYQGGIYLVRATGGKPHRVVAEATTLSPKWSPDGREIAFVNDIRPTECEIDVVDANGQNRRTLTHLPAFVNDVDWSPDGKELVFSAYTSLGGDPVLEVAQADGQGLRTVTAGADGGVSWSPDGRLIAYEQFGTIKTVHPDGSGVRTLTSLSGPFGEAVAWQRFTGR